MKKRRVQLGCRFCGAVVEVKRLELDQELHCPLCGSLLYRPGRSYRFLFTLSLVGLALYIGVIFLPILQISIPKLDLSRSLSLWEALQLMFQRGEWIIGVILVFTLLIIPPGMLLLLARVTLGYLNREPLKRVGHYLESYLHLREWNMAEIYLLAIFISLIKLKSLGEITLLPGLYFLLLFLSIFYFATGWFNPIDYWLSEIVEREESTGGQEILEFLKRHPQLESKKKGDGEG
ncbi:MAG: paraquat-inducible protein A [Campylobacterales bacterium]